MLLLEKILPGNALSASYFANKNKVVPPPPAPNTAQGTQSAPAPNQNQNQGPKKKIVDAKARKHILDGDETGGGHRAGTGTAGKSEFPANWSDDKIIQEVESVANDSTSKVTTQGSTKIIQGTRDGVDIKVVERNNRIVTGYPTSVPRNP